MAPDPVLPVSADSVPPAPPTVSPGLGLTRTVARLLLPVAVVAAVLMALVEALVGQRWQAEAQAYERQTLQGTAELMREQLLALPPAQWPQAVQALDARFAFPVALGPAPAWDADAAPAWAAGTLLLQPGTGVYHLALAPGHSLQLGPITQERNPEYHGPLSRWRWLQRGLWLGVVLLVAAFAFWRLRPYFQDLAAMRRTVLAWSQGQLQHRVGRVRRLALQPLAEAVDWAAQRLQASQAAQRAAASAVSHELRTPLARMKFGLGALEEAVDQADIEGALDGVDRLRRDVADLESLVDASLRFSRLMRDDARLSLAPVDGMAWLAQQIEAVRPLQAGALTMTLEGDWAPAQIDAVMAATLLRNLLRNAQRHARHQVRVTAYPVPQGWCLCVDDDGAGVPESERERVFEPWVRLATGGVAAATDAFASTSMPTPASAVPAEGYGLGLAIARRIAVLHGGSLTVQASPLGGARLVWMLPLVALS